ncbi:MAG: hypothetical protein IGS50_08930 [Synechococcales cyanobacterium C42_A2020_086]|nr:hypothetical protein [Synechococcales cyanobacterium M58_A2018_015]MBF2073873.1 hypothetical protein [Synechococcales cyanobacterium C42_A2020_086]
MVTVDYGKRPILNNTIQGWFDCLGGKPSEVVVVDGSNNPEIQTVYWRMFQQGSIDKLQISHSTQNYLGNKEKYTKEYTAGAISSKPYILIFKANSQAYQMVYKHWLVEAIESLNREEVFAVSASHNRPCETNAWSDWYFSRKCRHHFILLKRDRFMAAAREFADDCILSGFQDENPAQSDQHPYSIEIAFEQYMERYNLYTLIKVKEPS